MEIKTNKLTDTYKYSAKGKSDTPAFQCAPFCAPCVQLPLPEGHRNVPACFIIAQNQFSMNGNVTFVRFCGALPNGAVVAIENNGMMYFLTHGNMQLKTSLCRSPSDVLHHLYTYKFALRSK